MNDGDHHIPERPRRHGFTLIELLVVVSIMALLIGLLLPALAKAKNTAKFMQCANNIKNLSVATSMYISDYQSRLPMPNWRSVDRYQAGWLYDTLTYAPEDRETGTLWPYLQSHDMYRCPMHVEPYWRAEKITSYLMNGAVCGFGDQRFSYFAHQFRNDSILFWEPSVETDSWNDGSSYPSEGMTERHAKGSTMGVIDGHAEYLSREVFNEEVTKYPGRLWCNPGRSDGG